MAIVLRVGTGKCGIMTIVMVIVLRVGTGKCGIMTIVTVIVLRVVSISQSSHL